jgi:hypothetical protein
MPSKPLITSCQALAQRPKAYQMLSSEEDHATLDTKAWLINLSCAASTFSASADHVFCDFGKSIPTGCGPH